MTRPLILDLLPATHGAIIHDITYWGEDDRPRHYVAAWHGADSRWHASNGDGRGPTTLDPDRITGFTIHTDPDTTTWTEGADTNEWTATVRRKEHTR